MSSSTTTLRLAAMRHVGELGCAASRMEGQSHTGAEADTALSVA